MTDLLTEFKEWLADYGGYTIADVMGDDKGFYIMVDFEGERGSSNPRKVRIPEKFKECL